MMVYLRRPLALLCLSCCVFTAEAADSERPLFDSHDVLDVRITAPIERIARLRPIDEDLAGTFAFMEDGEWVEFDVGVRARGRYRRRPGVCAFPPLRLNFRKSQVDGTLFDGQDKLKLVTHCQSPSVRYAQALIAEYLTYRILNVLTESSFRARLLRIEYINEDDGRTLNAHAFLIEHKDELASRIGLPIVKKEKTPASSLRAEHANIVSVFQYLIGNTDFSPISGAVGAVCCHNFILLGNDEGPYYSVPYDFDMAGLVDAPHAEPNPKLRLYSVKERLYRGRCANNDLLPATLEHFRANRDAIEALVIDQADLTDSTRKEMLGYIDQFYQEIAREKTVQKKIIKKCK